MRRAAIYARFSTELQHERSIEDQVAVCRNYAERNELEIVGVYDDRARSGASMYGRDGLLRLLDAARDGSFEVILIEALDRLSRDQEDLAGIWKRLNFLGVELRALHEGTADQIQIGVRGLLGSLFLTDLAHKVRRGMQGVVRDGRHAGDGHMVIDLWRANRENSRLSIMRSSSFDVSSKTMSVAGRRAKSPMP